MADSHNLLNISQEQFLDMSVEIVGAIYDKLILAYMEEYADVDDLAARGLPINPARYLFLDDLVVKLRFLEKVIPKDRHSGWKE